MDAFLTQVLSVGLTLSQIFSQPIEKFRTDFNASQDEAIVVQHLKSGCQILKSQVTDSRFNIEALLTALVDDAEADQSANDKKSSSMQVFKKVDFSGMLKAYKQFCKGELDKSNPIQIQPIIAYYNTVFKNLRNVEDIKTIRLGQVTEVFDQKSNSFNDIFASGQRRVYVPIHKIPDHVKLAFIAAEDQNFYNHKGVDMNGLLRAFAGIVGGAAGRTQGGSTITQQLVKNLLINDDFTIERKMKEMLLATQLEKILTKDQILELYLNYVFLGRSSWGIEMASRSFFGPSVTVSNLSVEQAALLAGLVKGPQYYSPDIHLDRAVGRMNYVLSRMREDCIQKKRNNCLSSDFISNVTAKPPTLAIFESPRKKGGFYFMDAIISEARVRAKLDLLKSDANYQIQSTLTPQLQKSVEEAVRQGLLNYESQTGRFVWSGPQGSVEKDVTQNGLTWNEALLRVQPKLFDVNWETAVVLDSQKYLVGLKSGQTLNLKGSPKVLRLLKKFDIVFVDVTTEKKNSYAKIKIPPRVQGSALILENKTGKILALSGGFSFSQSEYNRAITSLRQPGSTVKPFIYLTALQAGLQPNTLVPDSTEFNPPLNKGWRPKNYDRTSRGLVTFRTAIENSLNLPTVQTTARLVSQMPYEGLKMVQKTLYSMGIYKHESTQTDFAEVLGSRETRLIDLASAYATIANSGLKPLPYLIESISSQNRTLYNRPQNQLSPVEGIDRVSFYQLKKILEGTVSRGTAQKIKKWDGLIAGKTGTSNQETDAWFVGFTNEITVAVWMGYDDRKIFKNLGPGNTGGRVALPIAEKIFSDYFKIFGDPKKLNGPPDEIRSLVTEFPIDRISGKIGHGQFKETFRLMRSGIGPINTHQSLLKPFELETEVSSLNEDEDGDIEAEAVQKNPSALHLKPQPTPTQDDDSTQIEADQWPKPKNEGGYQPGSDDPYNEDRMKPKVIDPELRKRLYEKYLIKPGGG